MKRPSLQRTAGAGICGALAMNLMMLLTFRLIGFDRIDKANKQIEEAEKRYNDANLQPHWNPGYKNALAVAESKVKRAKENLESVNRQFLDFERVAYSRGVEPGWLRYQFSW